MPAFDKDSLVPSNSDTHKVDYLPHVRHYVQCNCTVDCQTEIFLVVLISISLNISSMFVNADLSIQRKVCFNYSMPIVNMPVDYWLASF